jgi:hypothetical protein
MSNYERLLETAMREVERSVVRQVEREFEARRKLPDDICEVPFIDGKYNPHAPPGEHAALKQRVIAALRCRKWFELEAPLWAQPLPLKLDDCHALLNGPNRNDQRLTLVSRYGQELMGMAWDYQRAPRFEVYCAQLLVPPG